MRAVALIAGRELRALLRTPSAWWMLAGLNLLSGLFLVVLVEGYVEGAAGGPSALSGDGIRLHDHLLAPWLGNTALVLLLLGPAVSMRALADEVRLQTLPLLLSAPVSPGRIVLGKFLGTWSWTLLALASTLWAPLWLSTHAAVDPGALAAAYVALTLVAADVVALGLAASSVTSQPAVALVLASCVALLSWGLGLVDPDPDSLASRLAMSSHVRDLLLGLVRASDLVWLLSLPAIALLLARQRVEAWRQP